MLTTAHPHLDRASGGMLNYAAAAWARATSTASSTSRPTRAEPEVIARRRGRASPPTCTRSGSASAGSCWPSSRSSSTRCASPSAAARTSRTTAGSPSSGRGSRCSTAPPARPEGPFETDAVLRLSPRQRLRGRRRGRGRHLRVRGRRRSSRTSTSSACAPASRSREPQLRRFRIGPAPGAVVERAPLRGRARAAADQLRALQRAALPLRLGRRLGRVRLARDRREGRRLERARPRVWAEPGCFAGEPVFVAEPGAEAEDDGRAALGRARRRARAARSCSCSTPRRSRSSRGPRRRTTSRSASTASSRPSEPAGRFLPCKRSCKSHRTLTFGWAPDYGRGRRGPRGPAKECRARRSTTAHSDTASRSRLPCSRAPWRSRSPTARAPAPRPRTSTRSAPSRTRSAPSSPSRTPPSIPCSGRSHAAPARGRGRGRARRPGGEARHGEDRPRGRARCAGGDASGG